MRCRCRGVGMVAAFGMGLLLSGWADAQDVSKSGGDFSSDIQPVTKVPKGVILVKGAWSSASDSATPVPESGGVSGDIFDSKYFGLAYTLPPGWTEKYKGPPPSDTGHYVLAQIGPADSYRGTGRGSILITAQDMFFAPFHAANAFELVDSMKADLQPDYKLELPPTELKIGGQSFRFFAYQSPVAELHWYVAATEIRCHEVEIVLSSRDTKLLESLLLDLNKMKVPEGANPKLGVGGGAAPVCIKDYVNDDRLITRVDPVLTDRTFNPVPVRIIIDKSGRVEHIHFLSAFPEQAKTITTALEQWKFKPYTKDGHAVEVETGIMFGRAPRAPTLAVRGGTTQ
jgi:hypothetical protein